MIQLHLFSSPGEGDVSAIIEACRPYLIQQSQPVLAYLPAAAVGYNWLDYTQKAFKDLAEIALIDVETMTLAAVEAILDRSGVLYISGGNTFLLNHRLHTTGAIELIQRKVRSGLPLVGFSAGTILCGPNILTSSDMNICATSHFAGLGLTPYNFDCHYPEEETLRAMCDEWLVGYHVFHHNPIIILADGDYIRVTDQATVLARGNAWLLAKGQPRQKIATGEPLPTL